MHRAGTLRAVLALIGGLSLAAGLSAAAVSTSSPAAAQAHLASRGISMPRPALPRGVRYAPHVRVLPQPTKIKVTPDTAQGCNPFFRPHTCIFLFGKGLTVDDWATTSDITQRCATAFFEEDGQVVAYTYPPLCNGPGLYTADGGQWVFGRQVKLFNFWQGGQGLPCEIVHP